MLNTLYLCIVYAVMHVAKQRERKQPSISREICWKR